MYCSRFMIRFEWPISKCRCILTLLIMCEIWLWSSRNDFIASTPVYVQLTENSHLHRTWAAMHFAQQCCHRWKHFWHCCCVEYLSVPLHFFIVLSILKSLSLSGRLYFWKEPEVIWSQIRGIGWVFHFSNKFLGQKLLEQCHGGEFNCWTKVQAFLYAQLHITTSLVPYNKLGL